MRIRTSTSSQGRRLRGSSFYPPFFFPPFFLFAEQMHTLRLPSGLKQRLAVMGPSMSARATHLTWIASALLISNNAGVLDASDHQQYAANLRQQRKQDQSQHREVIARGPQHAPTDPRNDSDGCYGLRIG